MGPFPRNLKLIVAYCGTAYLGWQETQEGPSIECELRRSLETLLNHVICLQAASRTDRGVHARGQVVQCMTLRTDWDLQRLRHALQGLLPHDIAVESIEEAPLTFHPTLEAVGKEYRYYFCLGATQLPFFRETSWHVTAPLNLNQMCQALPLLTGTRDFRALCNQRKQLRYSHTERTLEALTLEMLPYNRLVLIMRGNHFLYKMARNLAGLCVAIGQGVYPVEQLQDDLLAGKRKNMAMTAPAHGLFLERVFYPP